MRKILCARIDAFDALLNRMKNIISRTVGQSRHVTPNRTIRIRLSNPFFFFFLCKLKKNKRDRNKHKILIHKIPIAFISVCPNKNAPYINICAYLYDENKVSLTRNFLRGTTITTISPSTIRYPQSTIFSFRYILDSTIPQTSIAHNSMNNPRPIFFAHQFLRLFRGLHQHPSILPKIFHVNVYTYIHIYIRIGPIFEAI